MAAAAAGSAVVLSGCPVLGEPKNPGVDEVLIVCCDGPGPPRSDRSDLAAGDGANLCQRYVSRVALGH